MVHRILFLHLSRYFACFAGIICIAGFALAAKAQAFPPGSVSESTLPNGLRLVLKRSPGAPLAAISVWIHAGSRNETAANNGAAHLLEHYLFQGKLSGDADIFDRQIEAMGGSLNAETSRDHTHFYAAVPLNAFEPALKVMGQMIQKPSFDAARIEVERRRAMDEVQGALDDPTAAARQSLFSLAYAVSPYQLPIAGTPNSIRSLSIEQVRGFYDIYYHPENATLVIVGDLTPAQALSAAVGAFSSWAKGEIVLPPVLQEPARVQELAPRLIPFSFSRPMALLAMGFPAPSVQNSRDAVCMDLIYSLLSYGQHSLIAQQVSKAGFISNYGSDFLTSHDSGLFLVWGYAPIQQVRQARQKIMDVVDAIAAAAFTDQDLKRARESLLGSYTLDNETAADQNNGLGFYDSISSYEYAVNYNSVVQSLTREDLRRVAQQYFRTAYTVVMAPAGTTI